MNLTFFSALGRRATIDDDSSPPRQVPLWAPWRDDADADSPAHKALAKRLDKKLDTGFTKAMSLESVVLFTGMLLSLVGGTIVADLLGLHWTVRYAIIVPGFAVSGGAARLLSLRRNRREIRSFLLEHGHCVSCGYALRGISACADGLTTCPECSAAWLIPTQTATAALPSSDEVLRPRAPSSD